MPASPPHRLAPAMPASGRHVQKQPASLSARGMRRPVSSGNLLPSSQVRTHRVAPAAKGSKGGGITQPSLMPSGHEHMEWVQSLLHSITDVERIGEADDSRLLPAIDAWLEGRLPFLQFSREVDSADRYGSTLLMVACAFGKVRHASCSMRPAAQARRTGMRSSCLPSERMDSRGTARTRCDPA